MGNSKVTKLVCEFENKKIKILKDIYYEDNKRKIDIYYEDNKKKIDNIKYFELRDPLTKEKLTEDNINYYCHSGEKTIPIYSRFIKRHTLKKYTVLEIISYYENYIVTDGAYTDYILLAIDKNNIMYNIYPLFQYITKKNMNSTILNYFKFVY
jgi:hypothetical protein